MDTSLPRVCRTYAILPSSISVGWRDGVEDTVDLAGWIATGGDLLSPLKDPEIFRTARPGEHGASIEWGDDDDWAIDAKHLHLLALAQRPYTAADISAWQEAMKLSNQEAADFFQTAVSTWNSYKAGAPIPARISMLCRAAERDPILMQAYYRPRKTGRPKKVAAGT